MERKQIEKEINRLEKLLKLSPENSNIENRLVQIRKKIQGDKKNYENNGNLIRDFIIQLIENQVTSPLTLSDADDNLSALAQALNILNEDIEQTVLSRDLFGKVINNLNDYVILINKFDEIKSANKSFLEMIGVEESEIVNESIFKHFKVNAPELGTDQYHTASFESSNGLPVEVTFYVIRINESIRAIIAQNVNDKIELEEKFEKERFLMKKALEYRAQFLANMSHEIRTPMNGIIGMIDVLKSKIDPGNVSALGYIDFIQDSSGQLLEIVNDILDLSKLESGKLTLRKNSIESQRLIDSIVSLFAGSALEKNVVIHSVIDENVPKFFISDKVRLKQVLSNLLGNAVKFSKVDTEINLKMSLENKSIVFSVEDNGIGMTKESLDKLFSNYSQVHKEDNKKYGGTGLGLAISKKIVELMHGNIEVESEFGSGSIFRVRIPYIVAEEVLNSKKHNIEDSKLLFDQKLKMLIVDDQSTNILVGKLMLDSLGFDVETAESGAVAIEKTQKAKFDVIFMDVQMPEMDGVEATKKIKEKVPNQLVIGLSANAIEGDNEKYVALGMDDYMTKPLTKKMLISVLNKWYQ